MPTIHALEVAGYDALIQERDARFHQGLLDLQRRARETRRDEVGLRLAHRLGRILQPVPLGEHPVDAEEAPFGILEEDGIGEVVEELTEERRVVHRTMIPRLSGNG